MERQHQGSVNPAWSPPKIASLGWTPGTVEREPFQHSVSLSLSPHWCVCRIIAKELCSSQECVLPGFPSPSPPLPLPKPSAFWFMYQWRQLWGVCNPVKYLGRGSDSPMLWSWCRNIRSHEENAVLLATVTWPSGNYDLTTSTSGSDWEPNPCQS